ncbi:MAG: 4-hydroxy-3-methylbut-2-enyl diphosphate reductase [Actinomycetota bacterium]
MARKILLAAPRGWCAGVDRAVEIVERVLELHGAPVYVRKQIVHNLHVVKGLEAKGAIFVETEQDVPPGSVCVLSAHGVAPNVYRNAEARDLKLIDATCPLVTKVHVEARRFANQGRTIFLIGHAGHEEVEGTSGQAPDHTVIIERPEEVAGVEVSDPDNVAFVSQTTLAMDDAMEVVAALRERFPAISGPTKDDICYASQNRQWAVKRIARLSDLVLVVGSTNSSNCNRLVEVAREAGVPSYLIEDETGIEGSWIEKAEVVGITSGASTPEVLVERVISYLKGKGIVEIEEVRMTTEAIRFPLPAIPSARDIQ